MNNANFIQSILLKLSSKDADLTSAQSMALTAFLVRIISAGIAFFSHVLFARLIGQFEYGIYAFVWVIVIILGNFSCLGFHTAQIRFLPIYEKQNDQNAIRGMYRASRLTAFAISTSVTGSGLLALQFLGDQIENYYVVPISIGLFVIPLIALGDMLDGTARANKWSLPSMLFTYLARPILIIVFMLLSIATGFERSATTAMQAALLATYCVTLWQLLFSLYRLRTRVPVGKKRYDYRSWLAFALPMFVVDGIGFLLTNADIIIVALYLPPDQVAIYFAAAKIIVLMQFVFFAVKAAAGPRFSNLIAEQNMDGLRSAVNQAARWCFWPSLILGLLLLLLGPWLLLLFGESFQSGYNLILILFVGFLAKSSVGPAETLLSMAGKQIISMKLYIIIFLSNIILNILLIPHLGLQGAAIAAALTMLMETILLYFTVKNRLNIRLSPLPQNGWLQAALRGPYGQ